MKPALLLLLAALASAQSPGAVTVTTTSNITATAGVIRCTVATSNQGATVGAYCYANNVLVFNSSTVISGTAPDKAQGTVISYSNNGESVTGMFWRPAAGTAVQWQITCNGVFKEGTF